MDIDRGLLLTLDALLNERNVTRAAARLGLGQSSLSARLARLREIFSDALFVPASTGRGIVPTPRAVELQAEVADLLRRLDVLLAGKAAFDPATAHRTFVIAIYESPAATIAPSLVSLVTAAAPGVRLAFVQPSSATMGALEQGEVDVLVAGADDEAGQLVKRKLLADDFLTAQRKGHPRGTGPLDLDTFCELDHLIVSTTGGFAGLIDRALAQEGRTRRVTVSVQSYALAPLILASSDCISTLPRRFLARFARELDFAPPPLDLSRAALAAFWHRRSQDDEGHLWLRQRLYETVSGSERPRQSATDRQSGQEREAEWLRRQE